VKEGETTNDLFGFLTTEPNGVVAPIHPKAMPVILTTEACPGQPAIMHPNARRGGVTRIVNCVS
jgi:hypothetical protein